MLGQIFLTWAVFLIVTVSQTACKNVVFLPLMVTSHTRAHGFVAEEMAKMGHKSWLALPSALGRRNTEPFPGVTTFRYNDFWEHSEDHIISMLEETIKQAAITRTDPDWSWIWEELERFSEIYMQAMREGRFTNYIESLKPDLIVLDWVPEVDERVAIAYKLKIPFAVLSPLHYPVTGRIPFNPVAEAYNSLYFRNNASLFQQLHAIIKIMLPLFRYTFNDRGFIYEMFPNDPNVPPSTELINQAEVYIVESDPIFDYARPVLPNVKFVGGLSIVPNKELKDPFKSFIARSEKAGVGVAVFSFGSLLMNLPKPIEDKLVKVVSRLSFNTIWRANITSPDSNKVLTATWLPLNDLLANNNVKVFITHSGMHSLYEALYHEVPTACVPLFFDQHFNAERAQTKGYCLTLDLFKDSEDEFVKIIEEVASSKKIRSSVNRASEIYRHLYKNPKQEAAFWLDHVMKYGGGYMRYSGQKMSKFFFILDYVIVFVAGVFLVLGVLVLCFIIKTVVCYYCRRKYHWKVD